MGGQRNYRDGISEKTGRECECKNQGREMVFAPRPGPDPDKRGIRDEE